MKSTGIVLDGRSLDTKVVKEVAKEHLTVSVHPSCLEAMAASREVLRQLVDAGAIIYSVTTGMGGMREFLVPEEVGPQMQMNLLRAVASNVGQLFPDEVVRAAMLARLNSLCRGHSAIQVANFMVLLEMLNARIHPLVPQKGSLGASGDLGPLACIALAATGEWVVRYCGEEMPASQALELAGIQPMKLQYKEGLALINGTSMMTGLAALAIDEMDIVCRTADVVAALSLETLKGRLGPFDERVHRQKPHPGQHITAGNIKRLTTGSRMAITDDHLQNVLAAQHSRDTPRKSDLLIMDAYSLRCIPQVHGPVKEYVEWGRQIIERELNSSNDDPLIISEYKACFHNGHFHGQYVAMVMDSIAVAATTLGMMSDRRIDRFMDQHHSSGLPPFLCNRETGVRLGMMGGQFMTSSLVAEARAKCIPLSIQSIPSTEDFQDFVSLGLVAARRTREVVRDCAYILAFELMCGAQAADIRGRDKLSPAGSKTYELTREAAPFFDSDRMLTPFLEKLAAQILDGVYATVLDTGVSDERVSEQD
jgi:histidine ammonia-lyase